MHVRALAVRTCPPNQFYIPVSGSTSLFAAGLCVAPLLEGVREAGMLLTPSRTAPSRT